MINNFTFNESFYFYESFTFTVNIKCKKNHQQKRGAYCDSYANKNLKSQSIPDSVQEICIQNFINNFEQLIHFSEYFTKSVTQSDFRSLNASTEMNQTKVQVINDA